MATRKTIGAHEHGLALRTAFEAYSDPDALRECKRLLRETNEQREPFILARGYRIRGRWLTPREMTELNKLIHQYRALESRLVEAFRRKLLEGELVATAIELPLTSQSNRIIVRRELWLYLTLGWDDSSAEGAGLKLIDVRVNLAQPLTCETAPAVRDGTGSDQASTTDQADKPVKARPGRPTPIALVRAKMEDRAKRGELLGSMKQEAHWLAEWNNAQDGHKPITSKTISNRLGADYRRLTESSSTR